MLIIDFENKLIITRVFKIFRCNEQNNLADDAWFGDKGVFNTSNNKQWSTNYNKIKFSNKTWEDYVKSKRLEISCGEAPYLVSRYDTVTGKTIKIEDRIGLLDRKLRVVYYLMY